MKQIKGKAFNIKDGILGRISFGNLNFLARSNEILVDKDAKSPSMGYLATITEDNDFKGGDKPYCITSDIDAFSEGDVVLIEKNGNIVFLYDIETNDNAIFATGRCNHHCIMCPQPPVANEINRTPFNLKLISLCDKGTKTMGITGGEPTMIGDDLFVLIKAIKKRMPKAAISILSNGVKFEDLDYAKKLALCEQCDLQIDIPIYSDIASLHNKIVGANTFYRTVKGLYNLALFNTMIGIRIVIHKLNYRRLPQMADFIYHNFPFVKQVAFMQMETTGLASDNFDQLWIDPYDYREEEREAVLLLRDRGIPSFIYNSQLCIIPEDIREFAVQSISNWKDIYINECEGCVLKGQCAGFFASNRERHSRHIEKITHLST